MSFWKRFRKPPIAPEPPPAARRPVMAAKNAVAAEVKNQPSATPPQLDVPGLEVIDEKPGAADPGKKGFDPYNSGAFDRRGNWDRARRR